MHTDRRASRVYAHRHRLHGAQEPPHDEARPQAERYPCLRILQPHSGAQRGPEFQREKEVPRVLQGVPRNHCQQLHCTEYHRVLGNHVQTGARWSQVDE